AGRLSEATLWGTGLGTAEGAERIAEDAEHSSATRAAVQNRTRALALMPCAQVGVYEPVAGRSRRCRCRCSRRAGSARGRDATSARVLSPEDSRNGVCAPSFAA